MCGITGVINFGGPQIDQAIIQKMTDTIQHRGPDGEGVFLDNMVALGHRRLSIIDLSIAGKQPMVYQDRYWISYNGEVYNFIEIKNELRQKGFTFKSKTDTEVLLAAFAHWGIDFVQRLNGMFAMCIYDSLKKEVFLVRDRLGIKPLFFSQFDNKLIFGSEPKTILAYPNFQTDYSPTGISSYLSYRYPLGEGTFFDKISQLSPGHYLKISKDGQIEKTEYWSLPIHKEKEDLGEKYYLEQVQERLLKSVKSRMISDVKIGAYLSGGVDSSAIVALMDKDYDQQVKTFTIGFEEEGYNEFSYARKVADRYNTEHHEIVFSPDDYLASMENLILFKDAPLGIANEPALFRMSKELKKHFTVVLSGEGADEIFGGYGRIFRSAYDFERMSKGNNSDEFLKNISKKYSEGDFNSIFDHFLGQYQYTSQKDKQSYLSNDFNARLDHDKVLNGLFKNSFDQVKSLSIADQYMWIFEKFHIRGLLQRVDTTTMAAAVEARVPFVDHELVEFALSIPLKYKLKWNDENALAKALHLNSSQISEIHDTPKYILKKAMEPYLPDDILYRKKVGFPVPIHKWLGKDFKSMCFDILLSQKAKNRNIYNSKKIENLLNSEELLNNHSVGLKVWMLLNLEMWMNLYFDKK